MTPERLKEFQQADAAYLAASQETNHILRCIMREVYIKWQNLPPGEGYRFGIDLDELEEFEPDASFLQALANPTPRICPTDRLEAWCIIQGINMIDTQKDPARNTYSISIFKPGKPN